MHNATYNSSVLLEFWGVVWIDWWANLKTYLVDRVALLFSVGLPPKVLDVPLPQTDISTGRRYLHRITTRFAFYNSFKYQQGHTHSLH